MNAVITVFGVTLSWGLWDRRSYMSMSYWLSTFTILLKWKLSHCYVGQHFYHSFSGKIRHMISHYLLKYFTTLTAFFFFFFFPPPSPAPSPSRSRPPPVSVSEHQSTETRIHQPHKFAREDDRQYAEAYQHHEHHEQTSTHHREINLRLEANRVIPSVSIATMTIARRTSLTCAETTPSK